MLTALMAVSIFGATPRLDVRPIRAAIDPQALSGQRMPMLSPTKIAEDETDFRTIISEDFSWFTEGSEEQWAADPICPNAMLGEPFFPTGSTSQDGWSSYCTYSAGGCLAIVGGFMNVPMGNYGGQLRIRFRARTIADGQGPLLIYSVVGGGVYNPDQVFSFNPQRLTNDWTEYELIAECPTAADDTFVQFQMIGETLPCLIDDIEVAYNAKHIIAPDIFSGVDFTNDSFTLQWNPVLGAEKYDALVYSREVVGTENYSEELDCESFTPGILNPDEVPAGWEISLHGATQVVGQDVTGESKALVISDDNDCILFPVTGGKLLNVHYEICRPTENPDPSGVMYMEVLTNGEWYKYVYHEFQYLDSSVQVFDMNELERMYKEELGLTLTFGNMYDAIRLTVDDIGDDVLYIDNLSFVTTPEAETETIAELTDLSNTSYAINDVDPYLEYFAQLRAYNSSASSSYSPFLHLPGLPTPQPLEAEVIDQAGPFSARWEVTPKADTYVVMAYGRAVVGEDDPTAILLDEKFNAVTSTASDDAPESYKNGEETSLDDLTEHKGWYGRGVVLANGKIGCSATEDLFSRHYLRTYEMTLSNNGGYAKITADVFTDGNYFVFETAGLSQSFVVTPGKWKRLTLELDYGQLHDYVAFYTGEYEAFLIDNVKIQTSLEAGDELFWYEGGYETDDTEQMFRIVRDPSLDYCFNVTAYQQYFLEEYVSDTSEMQYVDYTSGIAKTVAPQPFTLRVYPDGIVIVLADACDIDVYNLQGMKMAGIAGRAGENHLNLPSSGVYIVNVGGKSVKVSK
ncbi:MAG: hypothetical protein LUD17_02210 [Bacteroidales bacterium]|nr:hypothetical protein [Bacteroidales bacterium]